MATRIEMESGSPDTGEALQQVQELVGELLMLPTGEVVADVPLVSLGLESFVAVRLRRRLYEDLDCDVPLEEFLGDATVADIAHRVVGPRDVVRDAPGATGVGSAGGRADRTFDLTPIQAAYVVGRDPVFPLGGVATFYYTEFERLPDGDPIADVESLAAAWNSLVKRHGMLRVVMADGRQKILGEVPTYHIGMLDLRDSAPDQVEQQLSAVRHERSHQLRPADEWPLFDLYAVLLPDGRTRLCTGFDVMTLDLQSWMQLLSEWGQLVGGGPELPALSRTFADVVDHGLASSRQEQRREVDRKYWASRDLPDGPALPWCAAFADIRNHRFERHTERLPAEQWERLQQEARRHGLSATGLLLSAFGFTLRRWGADQAFCLNATLFDRDEVLEESADPQLAEVIGDFTSTVLVEVDDIDQRTWTGFAAYASAVNRTFWEAIDHRSVAGVSVIDTTDRTLDPATGLPLPTHPVVFTSGLGLADESYSSWLGAEVYGVSQTPQVLVDHIVRTADGDLLIDWDHVVDVLPPGYLVGMAEAHTRLLQRLAEEPTAWTDTDLGWQPSLETPPERVTGAFGDCGPLIDDPWRSMAAAQPDRPALSGGDMSYSYGDLRRLTARNAEVLTGRGCGPGELVGVIAEKNVAQVVAALSVVGSGAAYVPIEPGWPASRIASVVEQAGIKHVLEIDRDADAESSAWRSDVIIHPVAPDGEILADADEGAEPRRSSDADLAYTIFTSGSTGQPKGVAIEHRAARATLDDLDRRFPLGHRDCMLGLAAFSFDLSVYDIFSVLGSGGRLELPDPEGQRDPSHWLEKMGAGRVTTWNTAPALLEMLVEYGEIDPDATRRALADLRLVFLSGDWIPVNLPDRLRALAPQAQVVSLGGATEASIWSICFPIGEVDPTWPSIPYGRALAGQFFHILDDDGRPCPVGVAGELHIGGEGLAREYVGNPSETLSRFVTNPLLRTRLYRTGDLGRWLPDGNIQFLGRVDRQVKIRGHRIELGEIDSTLEQVPGVRHALARAVQGPDARPRLVAYVCVAPNTDLDDDSLIDALHDRLPAYMVPNHFIWMDQLPITENGKVDYRGLPNPFGSSSDERPEPEQPDAAAVADSTAPEIAPSPPHSNGADPGVRPEGRTVDRGGNDFVTEVALLADAGLELRLVLESGQADPVQALRPAADWSERMQSRLQSAGMSVTARPSDRGLLELAIARGANSVAADATAAAASGSAPPIEATGSHNGADLSGARGVAAGDPAVEREVERTFAELLGRPVDLDTPYFRLGASSLTLVNAHRLLQEKLDPELAVVELFSYPTVRRTAEVISRRQRPEPSPPVTEGAATTDPPDREDMPVPDRRAARMAARAQARMIAR